MKRPLAKKYLGLLLIAIGHLVGFLFIWTIAHELSAMQKVRFPLYFDWESRISFQPWALPIYFSFNVAVAIFPFLFKSWKEAFPPMGTLLLQTAIASPFFVLVPIELGYANDMLTGVWGTFLYEPLGLKNGAQWNQAPSLHVCGAFTLAWCAPSLWRKWTLTWATLVAISTMLIHEHHLICVITGFILFLITIKTIYPWLKIKTTHVNTK